MTLSIGTAAPLFHAETAEQERFSLEVSLGAEELLLCFVKATCPTCRFVLPLLEKIHRCVEGREPPVFIVSQNPPTRPGR